jgi:hypothetical protein
MHACGSAGGKGGGAHGSPAVPPCLAKTAGRQLWQAPAAAKARALQLRASEPHTPGCTHDTWAPLRFGLCISAAPALLTDHLRGACRVLRAARHVGGGPGPQPAVQRHRPVRIRDQSRERRCRDRSVSRLGGPCFAEDCACAFNGRLRVVGQGVMADGCVRASAAGGRLGLPAARGAAGTGVRQWRWWMPAASSARQASPVASGHPPPRHTGGGSRGCSTAAPT